MYPYQEHIDVLIYPNQTKIYPYPEHIDILINPHSKHINILIHADPKLIDILIYPHVKHMYKFTDILMKGKEISLSQIQNFQSLNICNLIVLTCDI